MKILKKYESSYYKASIFLLLLSFIIFLIAFLFQNGKYYSYSDLGEFPGSNLGDYSLYDFRYGGGFNFNHINYLNSLLIILNNYINNIQLISSLNFIIFSFINFYIYLNNFRYIKNNIKILISLFYSINFFTVGSYFNITSGVYLFYAVIPLIFKLYFIIFNKINVPKLYFILSFLYLQIYFFYKHQAFIYLLFILISLFYLFLFKKINIKNYIFLLLYLLVINFPLLFNMVIYALEQYHANKIFNINYSSIFLKNNISFYKILIFARDHYIISYLGLIIPFLIVNRLFANFISIYKFSNNLHTNFSINFKFNLKLLNDKYFLFLIFFCFFILFFIADLGFVNYLKSLIFGNIVFFYPLRTLDKLYSFIPFIFISIFIYRLKTINRNYFILIFSILIFLSIIKSVFYFEHKFKPDGLSHTTYKLTSHFNHDYLEASNYINNNLGLNVLINKRKNEDLIGWVEIQDEFILGKHPLINIINESIINIYDKNLLFKNVNYNLGSLFDNNYYEELYIILKLMSIRNVIIDKANLTDNNIIILGKLKKMEELGYLTLKFKNNKINIYELNNFLGIVYTSNISTTDIFSSPFTSLSENYKKLSLKNCVNNSCESVKISNFIILNRSYSPFWTYDLFDNKLLRAYSSPLGNNEFVNKKGSAGSVNYLGNFLIKTSIYTNLLSLITIIASLIISWRHLTECKSLK